MKQSYKLRKVLILLKIYFLKCPKHLLILILQVVLIGVQVRLQQRKCGIRVETYQH